MMERSLKRIHITLTKIFPNKTAGIPQQCDEPSDLVETSKWGPAEHVMKMWYRFTFPRQEGQLHNLEGSFFLTLTFQVHQRSQ